jgi:hypothetical protein
MQYHTQLSFDLNDFFSPRAAALGVRAAACELGHSPLWHLGCTPAFGLSLSGLY